MGLSRIRWYAPQEGSDCPLDRLMDSAEATVTVGVRQLCCELGLNARSFARGAQSLRSAAQVAVGEELFRAVVESEGKAVLAAAGDEGMAPDWSAAQCKTPLPAPAAASAPVAASAPAAASAPVAAPPAVPAAPAVPAGASAPAAPPPEVSRLYVSADGVLAPTTTTEEKRKRRATATARRRAMPRAMPRDQRRRLPPLRPPKKGSDQRYKQLYLTSFYDQEKGRRLVGVTRGGPEGLARLLKRDAARVRLRGAVERVGLVDGAVPARRPARRQAEGGGQAAELRGHVAERREMIAYGECDERGWDVGTGPMESMCGVTTDRVKGRGRRWDIDNAESLMALEALHQSNLWDQYRANALANALACQN